MKKLSLLAVVLVTVLTSCSKYAEGPSFTLVSAKSRLANTWTVSAILDADGTDMTSTWLPSGSEWVQEISKEGTWSSTYTYTYSGVTYTDTETGTWAFSDDKLQLYSTDSAGTSSDTSNILKLTTSELWLESPSDSIETHMITKE